MDANGTRFHALWGHAGDWKNAVAGVADARAADGVLLLKPQTPTFENVSAIDLKPQQRRGTARDRFGNWYWVAPSEREILVRSSGTGAASSLWPVPPAPRPGPFSPAGAAPQPERFAGAAVTRHHVLVVGTLDPPGLLAFDLAAGGPPRRVAAPPGVAFAPFDLAALGDGVVVLDRQNRAAWAFDRDLVPRPVAAPNPTPDRFQPTDATLPRRTRDASPPAAVPLPAGWPPALSVDGISCDAAWVLHEAEPDPARPGFAAEDKGSAFAKVDWAGPKPVTAAPALGTRAESTLKIQDQQLQDQPVAGHDFAFVSADRVEVALAGGTQAVAFRTADLFAEPDFIPLRKFGGLAYVGAPPGGEGGTRPGYDSAGKWVPAAVMPRPRFAPSAELLLPSDTGWDGKTTDCVWHRVFLDACIPPGCSVRLRAEVRNTEGEAWQPATAAYLQPGPTGKPPWQPDPILRPEGSELPFAPPLPPGFETWETLLHGARGRYLRLTLALSGDRERTPRVRAVRAWYPRFSYVWRYLPAIYRDDADSADYLERFLANAEGTLTATEDRIVAARSLVDPRTAPAEALDWLTGWLGLAASPGWDPRKKRAFLRHAPEILRRRGTIRGLQWALHLALDDCVNEDIFKESRTDTSPYRVVETFRRRAAPAVALGDPTVLDLPRQVAPVAAGRWYPDHGPASLNARYAEAQGQQGKDVPFPLCPPADANGATKWADFARRVLGFLPAARPGDPGDESRWAGFLRRRYRTDNPPGAPLPATLDVRPSVAADWYAFETVVMASLGAAHRFEVLIPTMAGTRVTVSPTPAELEESRRRRDLAREVVRREAPAHCRFEVRLYASAFRVGGSRVGADTLLGQGSRSPDLYDDAVLGASFLGEAFLAARPPLDQPGLTILGETPTFRARTTLGASPR